MTPLQSALIEEGYDERDVMACPHTERPDAVLWLWERSDGGELSAFEGISCYAHAGIGPSLEEEAQVRKILDVGLHWSWLPELDAEQARFLESVTTVTDVSLSVYLQRVARALGRGIIDQEEAEELIELERLLIRIGAT